MGIILGLWRYGWVCQGSVKVSSMSVYLVYVRLFSLGKKVGPLPSPSESDNNLFILHKYLYFQGFSSLIFPYY